MFTRTQLTVTLCVHCLSGISILNMKWPNTSYSSWVLWYTDCVLISHVEIKHFFDVIVKPNEVNLVFFTMILEFNRPVICITFWRSIYFNLINSVSSIILYLMTIGLFSTILPQQPKQKILGISVINQLDAQNFCFTISLFHASTRFEQMCTSSGAQNCITQPLVSSYV